jgi:predicted transcriptional regulator
MPRYASVLVLAVTAANAEAILSGRRAVEVRKTPPKRLPARAYLAVSGTAAVAGECVLGEPVGKGPEGTLLPIGEPKTYRRAKELKSFGLKKVPRSFRYID